MTPIEAVQITDAFKFSDFELGSVLGRFDGRVYETLMEEVKRDPVNSEAGLKEDMLELIRGRWRHESKL
jgi:Acyl-CoA oxidase